MEPVNIVQGTRCLYQEKIVRIQSHVDFQTVVGEYEATGATVVMPVKDLYPLTASAEAPHDVFLSVPADAYAEAQRRLEIIQPLLHVVASAALVAQVAESHGVGRSTIRRWLGRYKKGGTVVALVNKERTGGRGVSRLAPAVEAVLQQVILTHYPTLQAKAAAHVFEELQRKFHGSPLRLPSDKTLRARLNQMDLQTQEAKRFGARAAKERFAPTRPTTLQANYPLAVVQLDHALLNIVLVHEETRQQMCRPWLTIATDVYSRMVVGFYLAFEEPGAGGTGLCLAHAILPKETWLSERDVIGEWPCWGLMEALHLDNAKEFHGTMLQRASEHYGIKLLYRPPRRPEYGGNVERLIKTIKFHVRRLPGALVIPPAGVAGRSCPNARSSPCPRWSNGWPHTS
ncbi:helix-turn-helix domain-containing protein [Hymenobacter sp. PAMC 26628]|uniref:helix-turn-helix domain-containing protein n=1 Tax=Hymenobacter sp. PAMC 26628 TaxID=1484118 RepID=UPI0012FF5C05|nr:helix-turn-helix domain-containing protein [Hymenobacter sp. PAMC 26628]